MKSTANGLILDHLCRTVGTAALGALTDAELLGRFRDGRGRETEAAFAVLVQRHGPMVYRTCRLALRDGHDADDAFQAAFFVLARKAKSLKLRGSLGPWLYEVARRVSAHARTVAARRMRHEQKAAATARPTSDEAAPDHAEIIHDALGRLPERMRTPIVLCDLEGLSYQETAERLGWSLAAVRNQLSRARQRLRAVLERMGLDPAAASVAWHALPPVTRELSASTAISGARMASGVAAGAVSASVMSLTNQGIQSMVLMKLKTLGLSVTTAAVLVAGAYGLSEQTPAEKPTPATAGKSDSAPDAPPAAAQSGTARLIAKLTKLGAIIERPIDAPLRDTLDFLSDKYQLSFVVDVTGFDRDNGNKMVEDTLIRLPKMTGVDLNTVLRHLLVQVGGTFLVRADHIEIVTDNRAFSEAHGRVSAEIAEQRKLQPLVSLAYTNMQLANVLADAARQAGRNIVLDSRVTDRDKLTVTATLLNVPIDTAARVLAEMTNLKCVPMDNVFFVTTRDFAVELQEEEARVQELRFKTIRDPKPDPAPKPGPAPVKP